MNNLSIENVLLQLRTASEIASGAKNLPLSETEITNVNFDKVLKAAVDQVNETQQAAVKLTREFTGGETDKNLHEVMISLQKANISFQSMVQMRNKLVESYQTIMRMQV